MNEGMNSAAGWLLVGGKPTYYATTTHKANCAAVCIGVCHTTGHERGENIVSIVLGQGMIRVAGWGILL